MIENTETLRLRRSVGLSFSLKDKTEIDASQLLRGGSPVKGVPVIHAASVLTESTHEIELADFEIVSKTPQTEWTETSILAQRLETSTERLKWLADAGLLVCDCAGPIHTSLRDRDNKLRTVRWNHYTQLSHFMTKWTDEFLENAVNEWSNRNMPSSFVEFEKRFGPAPPPLLTYPDAISKKILPDVRNKQEIFRLLEKRRTTRSFNHRRKMSLSDLSTVLRYCFGCHGYRQLSKTLTVLKKTSPSGGALHPIEVFPLITRVEGIDAGAHHYDVANHSLDLLDRQSASEVQESALRVVAGQEGLGGAHVIFALVARFDRYFWKYRNHGKAYKALSMDAAHLTQTLFMVCTQLGLGAFVTGAINDKFIEELFDLDGINHGVMAICGCGIPNMRDPREFKPIAFEPGKSTFIE